jgi:hypothetical protein
MKLTLRMVAIGSFYCISSVFGISQGTANAIPSERIAGSYVCLNNPAPECRNPVRQTTPTFACINNANPECRNPPRFRTRLEAGAWSCRANQNVKCDQGIRYSVEDRDTWEGHFDRAISPTTPDRSQP